MIKHLLRLSALFYSASVCTAGMYSFSFEEAGTFENNWTQVRGQPNAFAQDLTAGVGSSGGLVYQLAEETEANDVAFIYSAEPVGRFGSGTISMKFRYDAGDASGNPLYIGLTTAVDNYPSLGGDNFGDWFGMVVSNRSNGTEFRVTAWGYDTDEETFENTQFWNGAGHPETFVTFVDNTWYQIDLTIEDRGNGNWNLITAMHQLNVDGTAVVQENLAVWGYEEIQLADPERATLPPLSTLVGLYRAQELYLFLGSQNGQQRGLTAIDEIVVDLPPVIDYAEPIVYDFEGENPLADWTQVNGDPDNLSVVADGGIGGSTGIGHTTDPLPEQQFTIGYVNEMPVGSFGNGYMSAMFKYVDDPEENGGVPFFFGLSTIPDPFLEGAPSAGFGDMFQVNISNRSNGTQFRAEIWGVHEGQDFRNGAGHPETFVDFVDNTWYKVTLFIYDNGDGTWNLRAVMDQYNEDGTELVQANFAVNDYEAVRLSDPERATLPTLTNFTNISRAPALYAYFGGQIPWKRGVPVFDQIEVSLPPVLAFGGTVSTFTFDEAGSFPDGWVQVESFFDASLTRSPDAGVGDSGAVVSPDPEDPNGTTYIYPEPIGLFGGGEISAFIRYDAAEARANPFYVGLATRPDFFHDFGSGADDYIKLNVQNRSNGTEWRASIYGVSGNMVFENGSGHPETFFEYVDNTWYKITLRIVEDPVSGWNLRSIIDLYNEDGTQLVQAAYKIHDYNTVQMSDPERGTLPSLDSVIGNFVDKPVYVFIGGQGAAARGVSAIDNVAVVLDAVPPLDYTFFESGADAVTGAPWLWLPTTHGWAYPYNTSSETGWYFLYEKNAYIYTGPGMYPSVYYYSAGRIEWAYYIQAWNLYWGYISGELFD